MESFIKQHPIHTEITVAWGEMDALQHVNNVIYFKYFESARIDFFTQIGLFNELQITNIGPVLADNNARYKRPITYPDTLLVGVTISDVQTDRFMMNYTVFSQTQQAVTTLGRSLVVMFDFNTGKKSNLSDKVLNALKNYEQQA
ncbi:acyl-CoA thioesterase [Shewanella sp. VB17]|uniref:acyl-CoA thioesterase n=1 Tax=Shewanella sp. VB17 TaxID=2739432 RepID=UPI001564E2F5|nr:thioesterase family protein [Shewanella sp. VB17]NRD71778.1 acyl-CoA thioesterase [Shewanella sp. VB17]